MPLITYTRQGQERVSRIFIPHARMQDWIALREGRGDTIEAIQFAPQERASVVLAATGEAGDELTELELLRSDLAMARVTEDLLAALEAKGVLKRDDLPQEARAKIAQREQMRQTLGQ